MSTPGRKPEHSSFRKNKLSSDAIIIIALIKKQPQTKEEICQKALVGIKTFYRIASFLEEKDIIKRIDGLYALWNFDFLEKTIEDALSKLLRENLVVYPIFVVNEIGKPWPEIEAVTYKIANKLGLTITEIDGQKVFLKTN